MLKRILAAALVAVGLGLSSPPAMSAGKIEVPDEDWSWEGVFGRFDDAQLRRGFQVYKQVCASCHGMDFMSYRMLTDIGYSEEEVKEIAAQYEVEDGPDETGEMFFRPAEPSDTFVSPFRNEAEARYVNNGAYPVDLSVITKARPNGANYLFHLMLGYSDPPEGVELRAGSYYNEFYPGHLISMPQMIYDDGVVYEQEGAPQPTAEQQARDVTAFLHWSAEPTLEQRKSLGLWVIGFLVVLTLMLYQLKRQIWSKLDH